jgi:hypothetical protein
MARRRPAGRGNIARSSSVASFGMSSSPWFAWALAPAAFAALTAIFAELGVQNVDSDLA